MLAVFGHLNDLYIHTPQQFTHSILFGAVVILPPAVLYSHPLATIVRIEEVGIVLQDELPKRKNFDVRMALLKTALQLWQMEIIVVSGSKGM